MKKWTQEEVNIIIELYPLQKSIKYIAATLGRSYNSVIRKIDGLKNKQIIKNNRASKQTISQIEQLQPEITNMINNGSNFSKISKELQISIKLLSKFCNEKHILPKWKKLKMKVSPEEYAYLQKQIQNIKRNKKRKEKYQNLSKEEKFKINKERTNRKLKNKNYYNQKARENARLNILRLCGMSLIEAKNWYNNTEKKCKICDSGDNLGIDHCHKKMIIRGFLCRNCNAALGMFKEDINLLNKAIEYIKRHNHY